MKYKIMGLLLVTAAIWSTAGCEYVAPQEQRKISEGGDQQTPQPPMADATSAPADADNQAGPRYVVETSMGNFTIELWPDKAPITVKNFLEYVDEGYYNGTIFHRVISGFMIQGGGFDRSGHEKIACEPIRNEADNGCKNTRGTVAMARTPSPDSATCQFFVNVVDNPALDHKSNASAEFGYCVFGKVVEGMETVDKIRYVKTGTFGRYKDWPQTPVVILGIKRAQ